MRISEESYQNFGKCIVLDNGDCVVKITVDVGPRIVYYALNGAENVLKEDVERRTYRDGDALHQYFATEENWYIYGGHRLWSSPESFPESYTPDNGAVSYRVEGGRVILSPADRVRVGERHGMTVELAETGSRLTIGHTITNIADRPLRLAPWCLTVADRGGVEIIPQSRKDTGLLANRRLVLWAYTDIGDERLTLGNDYLLLRQTDKAEKFKLGMNNEDGWSAYLNKGQLFIKRFGYDPEGEYPDGGCNFETFTDPEIMEVESLGALKTLAPGETTEHEERWELISCAEETPDRANVAEFVKRWIE
ncbi:MAG: DUF4380 domain-containing protein [Bacteroides sp.]|nr:DUF4380 domain-containing protein [Eubacterium sp.]MCM1418004.1 DUF4380 domain-containing protein [Roseburia sp.]MCM1462173.1 DUF4380 domain-containing protein [Bacteroides sp.]